MTLAIRTLRDVYLRDLWGSEGTTKIVKSYRGILWAAQLVRRQPFEGRLGPSLVSVEAESKPQGAVLVTRCYFNHQYDIFKIKHLTL